MHNIKGVVHMDLKAENILIDKRMEIILVDFGYATDEDIT